MHSQTDRSHEFQDGEIYMDFRIMKYWGSDLASSGLRREFILAIGEAYVQFGYPSYCGWVEALLLLEPKEWTQQGISDRLSEVLDGPKYATSVPSVNRALKLLENYGIVSKTGSRKTCYNYRLVDSANAAISMLQQMSTMSRNFVERLDEIAEKNKKRDKALARAIGEEMRMAKMWDKLLARMLESPSEEE